MQALIVKVEHLHFERLISMVEWVALALLVVLYVYNIVLSVTNVVLRQELTVAVERAEAHIGELETAYLARSAQLTEKTAQELGFVSLHPLAYVQVGTEAERLSRAD